tara:strand:- start:404 stop:853 length:450 start_codon:yes stop_codon:yes gene_type:complete
MSFVFCFVILLTIDVELVGGLPLDRVKLITLGLLMVNFLSSTMEHPCGKRCIIPSQKGKKTLADSELEKVRNSLRESGVMELQVESASPGSLQNCRDHSSYDCKIEYDGKSVVIACTVGRSKIELPRQLEELRTLLCAFLEDSWAVIES